MENHIDIPTPKGKKKEKRFCLSLSLHFEDQKAVQYHLRWVDENGRHHNLSNNNKNNSGHQEE